ncbi:MAG: ABC-F family ATPase [gamma proteobacterium symbiont of Bathyaustriella thionipta]|nr:ABC-F family ATPase [gamma proteobacterium symbiont of Bathyaustriella thionipta]MCU7948662.1 ABC-F family ATPase [gamma proteobacterium symbiont of Bathyaustriella thionipta]MCU7953700.1 ABC-F family ATPase [gamma proteobacterium symbiont of Bathyaustriella thionipta]MCU7955193.1 ABC-F family ATPase [gamma proteobacterium symbiont of Bathyaustriella thionipta]MCU7967088.1 ABC-F family ATPase [gamma proteobacterium symbiont of Bathyaustriella thionipta]
MISTANLTIQFGAKPLFENVSVKFSDENRYGLIGANGCGKSTFMKILGGDLDATSGTVTTSTGERVGKLRQDQFAYEEYSVIDTVIMGHEELWQVKEERDQIYAKADMSEDEGMRVADLEVQYGEMDGYTAESRAGELLIGVGIPVEQHFGPMSAIAPGFKLRVLLAQVLFSDPDIMLLDEPTNNLDINTIRWLEDILNERNCTMIIISHDRHFLNSVCTHMADLDYGAINIYPGNYDEYMLAATQARERQMQSNEKKKAEMSDLQKFVERFSANASKAKQATSRRKRLEKIQLDDIKVSSRKNPFIRFEQDKKLYRNAFEIENLSNGYDELLFKNLDMLVEVGERIAIIGTNGIGKTTLLRTLIHDLEAKSGRIKFSENADIGYYPQEHIDEFAAEMTLFDWMDQWGQESDDDQAIRGILGRLLFSRDDSNKSVKVLSGGEMGRMVYGKLMLEKPNILFMDEPTNHMDMESIESLNMALDVYQGTLVFVSHDREFVSSLANRIVEIKEGEIIDFKGTYDEYLASQGIVE